MSKHENEAMNAKQVATNERSAIARLDRATEDKLYARFHDYFLAAERGRAWNLWTDTPWEQVVSPPPSELTVRVLEAYRDELMLPDYSAKALQILRASRGRAWFLTRWAYEEGKHLLALHEWLLRSKAYTDDQLRVMADGLLGTFAWEPLDEEPVAVLHEMQTWEQHEIERTTTLLSLAKDAGDNALTAILMRTLADEKAHEAFLREVLEVIENTDSA